MYTYATDKDGNYELKKLVASGASKNLAGYDNYVTATDTTTPATHPRTQFNGTDYANKRIKNTLIADDAVLFVVANTEIKVISGKTARDWANTVAVKNVGFLTKESNGIDYVKVAALVNDGAKVANADGDKLYAYVTEDSFETKKNGDTVTAFKAVVGNTTEAVDLYEDGTSHVGTAAGSVIIYTVDGDEIDVKTVIAAGTKADTENSTVFANGAYAIKGFDGKKKGDMSLVDEKGAVMNVTLDEDCVFIGVDDAKNVGTVSELGAVPTSADKDEFDRYDLNAYVVFNSENKVIAVVYDTVNNELNITNVKTESTVAAKALNVTSAVTVTGSDTNAAFTVTTDPVAGNVKWGTTVTVTVTPDSGKAVAANNKAVVTVTAGSTTVGTLTFAAGATAAQSVTFTMPNAVTAVSAAAVTSAVAA